MSLSSKIPEEEQSRGEPKGQSEERFIGFAGILVIHWLSDDKHLCPVDSHNEEETPGTGGIMDAESELMVYTDQSELT